MRDFKVGDVVYCIYPVHEGSSVYKIMFKKAKIVKIYKSGTDLGAECTESYFLNNANIVRPYNCFKSLNDCKNALFDQINALQEES